MPNFSESPLRFTPRSLCDAVDGDNVLPGACLSLQNLLFDPGTPGVLLCRPANLLLTSFEQDPISVGDNPAGMAMTPDGSELYVVNTLDDTVSVIATATNTVIATVAVGSEPVDVIVRPDGAFAYVTNYSGDTITKIDTATKATSTISSATLQNPYGLAVTPDGTKIYIVNNFSGTLSVLTVATDTISASTITLTGASDANNIVINFAGTKAYVAGGIGAQLFIVTLSGPTVAVISLGTYLSKLTISPDDAAVYVGEQGLGQNSYIYVVETATNTLANTIVVPIGPNGHGSGVLDVAFNEAGSILYFALVSEDVGAYSVVTGEISFVGLIDSFSSPIDLVIGETSIYASNYAQDTVSVVGFQNIVTAGLVVGELFYGLLGSPSASGVDTPFVYNIADDAFLTVNGITAAKVPESQNVTGDWLPPQMDQVGSKILVAHAGFNYAGGYAFGYFDISSFSTSVTGNTTSGSATITGKPVLTGVEVGYLLSGTGIAAGAFVKNKANVNISTAGDTHSNTTIDNIPSTTGMAVGQTISGSGIPAGTTIASVVGATSITISQAATATATITISVTGTTITMSANASATNNAVSITVAGGTPTTPLWCAGNTMGAVQLAAVATSVHSFNNRIYFGESNSVIFTDTFSTNITSATQVLTAGDSSDIVTLIGLPQAQTTGGPLQSLLAIKPFSIYQIRGDATTSDLTITPISGTIGSSAARSAVATPEGVKFMANDGIRLITLLGTLSDPDPDLRNPFINALYPSRVAAAYNSGIYRISLQNGAELGTPWQGYYRDEVRKGWTGPHTFQDDLILSYSNDFVVASNAIPGTLWKSFTVQRREDEGNTFIENGQQLAWNYQTCPMTDLGNIFANAAINTTFQMQLPAGGDTYQFQASDQSAGSIATAQITAPDSAARWGEFDWGDGTLWGEQQFGLAPQPIPWTNTLIFSKLVAEASGDSGLNLRLGSWYFGYEKLNYLMPGMTA